MARRNLRKSNWTLRSCSTALTGHMKHTHRTKPMFGMWFLYRRFLSYSCLMEHFLLYQTKIEALFPFYRTSRHALPHHRYWLCFHFVFFLFYFLSMVLSFVSPWDALCVVLLPHLFPCAPTTMSILFHSISSMTLFLAVHRWRVRKGSNQ